MSETTGAEQPARHCTSCGAKQQPSARFCDSCGAAIVQTPEDGPFLAPPQTEVPQFRVSDASLGEKPEESASTEVRQPEPPPQVPAQAGPEPQDLASLAADSPSGAAQTPAPQSDEMYCSSCGNVVKKEAEICVKCGVRLRRSASTGGKSKVAAILLAVFLGFWAWLYTYREDGSKFWIGLVVSIVNVVLIIITLGFWFFIAWIPALGFWLWPLIDAATRSDEWYASY